MDNLPFNILDEILFKLDLKSVGMMQCTDRSIKSHITNDQYFKYYLSRARSKLFHISTFGSNIIFWHSTDPRSTRNQKLLMLLSRVLGSCSGLDLHFVASRICVSDPFTKTSRFLDHNRSKFLPDIIKPRFKTQKNRIGLAVDQIDQRFKIACINEVTESNPEETMYQFEIGTEDSSWRLSETTITCRSSNLMPVKKPVYFDGYVHWLRNDGSILAFNPGTEKARLIPTKLTKAELEEYYYVSGCR
ncbi:putative F-box protein [Cardamine amara subsp. amara]|uniref:F-box protein n=1 Tax=Cardamine amara subsp. amara TaxID=228776 RepID=A0ABD1BA43_CARAN